jgi:hypothetical protein
MKGHLSSDVQEVMDAVHYRPAVSVILPFETKSSLQTELPHDLKFALDKVEKQLLDQYPHELALTVLKKLRKMAADLKIDTHKKGVALYASPVFEKLIYLDAVVKPKIVIDESFEIRDLIFCRKETQNYLLFILSGEECKLFLGNTQHLLPVKLSVPSKLDHYWHDEPERVANFSDPGQYKEAQVEKFIRQMDKELTHLLNSHRYPVFIVGSKSILGIFNAVTHNTKSISGSIEGNYNQATQNELILAVTPKLAQWKKELQLDLLKQAEQAANEKKLACGIQDVWHEIYLKKGRLLLVEKNFIAAGEHVANGTILYKPTAEENNFQHAHDVVDDAIELILKTGGDVAFVDEGLLTAYDHIALIKFYS